MTSTLSLLSVSHLCGFSGHVLSKFVLAGYMERLLVFYCYRKRSAIVLYTYTHTHTQPFNGTFSRTTRVSRYQKAKTNLDFTVATDSEWQWHQLGHMQICTSLQTDNHAGNPPLSFFTGWMPFLPPSQQRQSTEGIDSDRILLWCTYL